MNVGAKCWWKEETQQRSFLIRIHLELDSIDGWFPTMWGEISVDDNCCEQQVINTRLHKAKCLLTMFMHIIINLYIFFFLFLLFLFHVVLRFTFNMWIEKKKKSERGARINKMCIKRRWDEEEKGRRQNKKLLWHLSPRDSVGFER